MQDDYENEPVVSRNWESDCLRAEEEIKMLRQQIEQESVQKGYHKMSLKMECFNIASRINGDDKGIAVPLSLDNLVTAAETIYKSITKND